MRSCSLEHIGQLHESKAYRLDLQTTAEGRSECTDSLTIDI
jgi:hypothetical protein